jgi:hypothetical protein
MTFLAIGRPGFSSRFHLTTSAVESQPSLRVYSRAFVVESYIAWIRPVLDWIDPG